jgi:hypothetical protein
MHELKFYQGVPGDQGMQTPPIRLQSGSLVFSPAGDALNLVKL